ncbi:hypothetical protein GCM10022416_43280 [Actinomadura keratinilytica]|uniref:Uncharacterized protein n=1 Tax=Actinomadura keratinilytica TaxID=547461 RepID=A0ABP7Z6Z2_9ACTN
MNAVRTPPRASREKISNAALDLPTPGGPHNHNTGTPLLTAATLMSRRPLPPPDNRRLGEPGRQHREPGTHRPKPDHRARRPCSRRALGGR